jgi:hypothetical protein
MSRHFASHFTPSRLTRVCQRWRNLALVCVLGGCSGEVDDNLRTDPGMEADNAALAACGLPAPCPSVDIHSADPDALGCVLEELEAGRAIHVTQSGAADGPGGCTVTWEVYVGASGSAYVWRNEGCTDGDEPREYQLDRCSRRARTTFASCMDELARFQPGGVPPRSPPCSSFESWVEGCTPATDVACP